MPTSSMMTTPAPLGLCQHAHQGPGQQRGHISELLPTLVMSYVGILASLRWHKAGEVAQGPVHVQVPHHCSDPVPWAQHVCLHLSIRWPVRGQEHGRVLHSHYTHIQPPHLHPPGIGGQGSHEETVQEESGKWKWEGVGLWSCSQRIGENQAGFPVISSVTMPKTGLSKNNCLLA